jgi:mono/diheme cytochrome c family protein
VVAGFAFLVAIAVSALAFVYLGLFDVAATSKHWRVTSWVLSTAMERSVERHARDITAPDYLADPSHVLAGAHAYDEMCADCHGAPGVEAGAVGRGLEPAPPELAEEAGEWSAAEIFWITSHGVRMTGMPAFGPSHSDEELWDLVAFVRRLPGMTAAEYRALLAAPVPEGREHSHPR